MLPLLADLEPKSFWNGFNGSLPLKVFLIGALVLGAVVLLAILRVPARLRRPVVAIFTFVSGFYYVLLWLWPTPIARDPKDAAVGLKENVSFFLADAQPVVANFSNILSGFLLGLGVFSLLRIHGRKVMKRQTDWGFSFVLLASMFAMILFGYWDFWIRQSPTGARLPFAPGDGWGPAQYGKDLLFDGFLQQMDATMFSLIAFFILSAAYRAFRARSLEATVLLLAALIVVLSLTGLIVQGWDSGVGALAGNNPDSFLMNFRLTDISKWLRDTVQTPSIRGLDFGIGIGLLAMSLRLWLSLERLEGDA